MPVSPVADGDTFTSGQMNALIAYVQDTTTGHAHTGANDDGKQVSHASLVDGVISGRANSHAQIDAHLAAAAQVHGLPATANVMGLLGQQLCFVAGSAVCDTHGAPDPANGAYGWWSKEVTTNLTNVLGCVVTNANVDWTQRVTLNGAKFTARFQSPLAAWNTGGGPTFYYIAWGTKS